MKVLFFPGAFGNDERAEWWSHWPRAFLPGAEWVNVGYGADGPPCASVDEAARRAIRRLDALGLRDEPVVAVCYSSSRAGTRSTCGARYSGARCRPAASRSSACSARPSRPRTPSRHRS